MIDEVRAAYDANAELYASLFLDDLLSDAQSIAGLATFAAMARRGSGPVVDMGCGPGGSVQHLRQLGLMVIGCDLSPGQIAQARVAFPDLVLHVGDLAAPPYRAGSLGGIVARHALIHMSPVRLGVVFGTWMQVLAPAAPVFISFFGSRSPADHGAPFDHKVVTAYALDPDTVGKQLEDAGFTGLHIKVSPPADGSRPLNHVTMAAHKPATAGA